MRRSCSGGDLGDPLLGAVPESGEISGSRRHRGGPVAQPICRRRVDLVAERVGIQQAAQPVKLGLHLCHLPT